MIRILSRKVLPPWRAQREALHQLTTLSRLPTRQQRLVATLVEYMTARQEGWELLREGLRQDDPRSQKGQRETATGRRNHRSRGAAERDRDPRPSADDVIAGRHETRLSAGGKTLAPHWRRPATQGRQTSQVPVWWRPITNMGGQELQCRRSTCTALPQHAPSTSIMFGEGVESPCLVRSAMRGEDVRGFAVALPP